jgi:hypothetical protein
MVEMLRVRWSALPRVKLKYVPKMKSTQVMILYFFYGVIVSQI